MHDQCSGAHGLRRGRGDQLTGTGVVHSILSSSTLLGAEAYPLPNFLKDFEAAKKEAAEARAARGEASGGESLSALGCRPRNTSRQSERACEALHARSLIPPRKSRPRPDSFDGLWGHRLAAKTIAKT
ncbi:unnamed protein product [Cladocopium goreaui]|uniref:Uncharacterized protein n=1 Tax=Cladocopium goreaui TaxID=2562237 RepID=A0A9P1CUR0_9DINO|nr:unnamed protein product [Cladocopium goreaui]